MSVKASRQAAVYLEHDDDAQDTGVTTETCLQFGTVPKEALNDADNRIHLIVVSQDRFLSFAVLKIK